MIMFLGLDTSCYTTSAALISSEGCLLADERRVLDVPLGRRGLSQSEALFQHIRNLPDILTSLGKEHDLRRLQAIGVSAAPRNVEGSYMPVFLGGLNAAAVLSAGLALPVYRVSHQEGHLAAAIFSSDFNEDDEAFIMCHFSGGTSEVCLAEKKEPGNYDLTVVAHSGDLHAGQFVDRIGVSLGFSFPAGKEVEKAAASFKGEAPLLKTHMTKDGVFSFSGPETALQRLIEGGLSAPAAARALEETVARTLRKALSYAIERTGVDTLVLAGGVMSNQYIASYIKKKLSRQRVFFADPHFASDNAVGVACLALAKHTHDPAPKM